MVSRFSTAVVTGLGLVAACGSAQAAIIPSNPFAHVDFTSGAVTGSVDIDISDALIQSIPGVVYFYPATQFTIFDTANPTLAIATGTVGVQVYDPSYAGIGPPGTGAEYRIDLNFSIQSLTGSIGTVNVLAPTLSIAAFSNASATASASFSATDSNANGELGVFGLLANGNMWEAYYNGTTAFASLLPGNTSNVVGGTITNSQDTPGFSPIAGSLTSIGGTLYSFNVSAGDSVSGTSTFAVVPAPGAAALLALGGVAFSARRRSRA